jgi:hypothetical protein
MNYPLPREVVEYMHGWMKVIVNFRQLPFTQFEIWYKSLHSFL